MSYYGGFDHPISQVDYKYFLLPHQFHALPYLLALPFTVVAVWGPHMRCRCCCDGSEQRRGPSRKAHSEDQQLAITLCASMLLVLAPLYTYGVAAVLRAYGYDDRRSDKIRSELAHVNGLRQSEVDGHLYYPTETIAVVLLTLIGYAIRWRRVLCSGVRAATALDATPPMV